MVKYKNRGFLHDTTPPPSNHEKRILWFQSYIIASEGGKINIRLISIMAWSGLIIQNWGLQYEHSSVAKILHIAHITKHYVKLNK